MMTPQRPYAEVVDWIDKELLEVSEHLPAVYPNNTDWGRATSIMALAIRAKTLLFAASPLFNGNPDLKDWKNSEGEFLFDAEAKPERWEKAAKAHLDLIKAAEAAGHKLYYEYNVDGSIDPFMSYYNMSLKRFSEGNRDSFRTPRKCGPELLAGSSSAERYRWKCRYGCYSGTGGRFLYEER